MHCSNFNPNELELSLTHELNTRSLVCLGGRAKCWGVGRSRRTEGREGWGGIREAGACAHGQRACARGRSQLGKGSEEVMMKPRLERWQRRCCCPTSWHGGRGQHRSENRSVSTWQGIKPSWQGRDGHRNPEGEQGGNPTRGHVSHPQSLDLTMSQDVLMRQEGPPIRFQSSGRPLAQKATQTQYRTSVVKSSGGIKKDSDRNTLEHVEKEACMSSC